MEHTPRSSAARKLAGHLPGALPLAHGLALVEELFTPAQADHTLDVAALEVKAKGNEGVPCDLGLILEDRKSVV